jgi:glycosyltransferase involved in cell wall biosynthesis
MLVSFIVWFVFGITISYLVVIGIITIGWYKLPTNTANNGYFSRDVQVSIIVAVRNEAENIGNLISHIIKQNYNKNLFNLIVIDDHSTDNTCEVIELFLNEHSGIRIDVVNSTGYGKKAAISEGVALSNSELIVTTDGDCVMSQGWLSSIVEKYMSTDCKLMLGPVVYSDEESLIQRFFSVDFASLVAAGAGSAGIGLPLMGNGANLIFKREVYVKCKPDISKYASGDDVFLLHEVTKQYGSGSVVFLKNEEAIVSTKAPLNINAFIKQRIRWGSKAKGYKLAWPVLVTFTMFLFSLILCLILLSSIYYNWLLPVYFLLIITKFVVDIPLVFNFLTFSNKSNLKSILFMFEFIYPVYIVTVAILSLFNKYEWKGRHRLK